MKKIFKFAFYFMLYLVLNLVFWSVVCLAKDIAIKNNKNEVIGKLTLSGGTTYYIYDANGKKVGTYVAKKKLASADIKGKKYKLIKTKNGYIIKE